MYPKEYIDYLVHFHGDRDYFECHEILEEYWKDVDKNNKESILVGFILFAVSNYHHRRGNFSGAERTLRKALHIFQKEEHQLKYYGLSIEEFFEALKERQDMIQHFKPYKSMILPLQDDKLLSQCKIECERVGYKWGQASDLSDENLVHRHSKRDRSDVINERAEAIARRQKKRQ